MNEKTNDPLSRRVFSPVDAWTDLLDRAPTEDEEENERDREEPEPQERAKAVRRRAR